ncbi:MAG: PEP-CTERM sorting domain-containing protein [Verrucomicrobiota bacterium]
MTGGSQIALASDRAFSPGWFLAGIALAFLCLLTPRPASANVVLSFEWLDSGGVFQPTEDVPMRGRITNTGDMSLIDAVNFGTITIAGVAPEVFDNYVEFLTGGFSFGPDTSPYTLPPSGSVDFTIATWRPFPITGSPGDPVPLGSYVVPNAALSNWVASTFNPFVQTPITTSGAGDFRWTVVPEPSSALLLLLSGVGVFLRQKKSCSGGDRAGV